jgi:hypothetical protein
MATDRSSENTIARRRTLGVKSPTFRIVIRRSVPTIALVRRPRIAFGG